MYLSSKDLEFVTWLGVPFVNITATDTKLHILFFTTWLVEPLNTTKGRVGNRVVMFNSNYV